MSRRLGYPPHLNGDGKIKSVKKFETEFEPSMVPATGSFRRCSLLAASLHFESSRDAFGCVCVCVSVALHFTLLIIMIVEAMILIYADTDKDSTQAFQLTRREKLEFVLREPRVRHGSIHYGCQLRSPLGSVGRSVRPSRRSLTYWRHGLPVRQPS